MMLTSNSDYNEGYNDCLYEMIDDLIEEMNKNTDKGILEGLSLAIEIIKGERPKYLKNINKWI